jgi:hypothetical protein
MNCAPVIIFSGLWLTGLPVLVAAQAPAIAVPDDSNSHVRPDRDLLLAPESGWQRNPMAVGWTSARVGPARFHLDGSWSAGSDVTGATAPWLSWGDDAVVSSLGGRVGAGVSIRLSRAFELYFGAGVQGVMSHDGASAAILADVGAELRWWFAAHWGIGLGASYLVAPGWATGHTPASTFVGGDAMRAFENETPWDDPEQDNDLDEAARRLLLGLRLLHRD